MSRKSKAKQLHKKKSIPPSTPDSSSQQNKTKKKKKRLDAPAAPSNGNSEQLNIHKSNTDNKPISSPPLNQDTTKQKKNRGADPLPHPHHTNQTPLPSVKQHTPKACPAPTSPRQPTPSTCKRIRKRPKYHPSTPETQHRPTPLTASSAASSQPNVDNATTAKTKKKKKKRITAVNPSPETSPPVPTSPTSHNVCNSARTPTSLPNSSRTRPPSPSASPPFRSDVRHRDKRATPLRKHLRRATSLSDDFENRETRPNTKRRKTVTGPHITSPVPPKCTNESDTSTQLPVHDSESPDPAPHLKPSQNFSHPHAATQPIRTYLRAHPTPHSYASKSYDIRKDVRAYSKHVSIDNHCNMPPYQNREHTWFHVGTNHQQNRSRIWNRNHEGTSLGSGATALERTYPNARTRKDSIVDARYGQVTDVSETIPRYHGWGPNAHQRNAYSGQPYSTQGSKSTWRSSHVHRRQESSRNQSSWAHTSAHAQSPSSPHRNLAQHNAYRGGPYRAPPQNRNTVQQPSPFPDAMQIDRPVERPVNTSDSTWNTSRNSNEASTHRHSGVQSGMGPVEQPRKQMACNSNTRSGQTRSINAKPSSQPLADRPLPSTKASHMNLQRKTASPTGEYYGIRCGRNGFSGVTTCWKSCSMFVVGYSDAVYEVFDTWDKAERFSDRCGTGASITHKSNFRHFFGGRRNGVIHSGSVAQLSWELENEPQVVSLVVGAAWLRFGIGSGIGAYGVFLSLNNPYNCAGLMEGNVTELRLQLKGLLEALEIVYQHGLVKDGGTVEVYTASQEVKNGIDHWLGRWDKSGRWVRDGKPVGSQDLWKAILNIQKELLKKGTRIHTIWIRRPNRVPALQQAVSLARVVFNSVKTDRGEET